MFKKLIFSLLAVIFLVFSVLVYPLAAVYFGWGCGPCLQKQDYVFLEKLKEHLPEKNDMIKVSDIHPGDWKKVCVISGGYNENRALQRNRDGSIRFEIEVINGADPYISEFHNNSAIYFLYGDSEERLNRTEIYKMTKNLASYSTLEKPCFDKKNAYFLANTIRPYFWPKKEGKWNKAEHLQLIKINNFIDIRLTSKEEN